MTFVNILPNIYIHVGVSASTIPYNLESTFGEKKSVTMDKNLSIRFNVATSAAAITPVDSPSQSSVTENTDVDNVANETISFAVPPVTIDCRWEKNDQLSEQKLIVNEHDENEQFLDASDTHETPKSIRKKNSIPEKVDRFVRQIQENFNGNSNTSSRVQSGNDQNTTAWYKFAKSSDDTLEIITNVGNQAESNDSNVDAALVDETSVTVPSTLHVVKSSPSILSPSSPTPNWLSDMKIYHTFRERFREKNEKKSTENSGNIIDGSDDHPDSIRNGNQVNNCPVGSSDTRLLLSNSSNSNVSVLSNPCLNGTNLGNNNHFDHHCGSCSSRHNNQRPITNVSPQSSPTLSNLTQSTGHCNTCARQMVVSSSSGDNRQHPHYQQQHHNKCSTPRQTPSPTPPLLLSPSEVVFDPNLDPIVGTEPSMTFSFRKSCDGKDKKDKRDKEIKESKKGKLFQPNNTNVQTKEMSTIQKKSKDKDKDKLSKMSRSSSISSPSMGSSSNNNSYNSLASFLSIISPSNNKNPSPSQSQSSSTENINVDGDVTVQMKNTPKGSKLSSSKSMISFRKLIKSEDATTATAMDDDYSATLQVHSVAPSGQGNPSLRRRADTTNYRRDSPTTIDEGNFFNDDNFSMKSKSSTSSSFSSATNGVDHEHLERPFHLPIDSQSNTLIMNDQTTSSTLVHQSTSFMSLHSGLFSWAMCFSYAYYVFALIVALLSFLISLLSPLPSFVNGFVLGFMFTFLLITVVIIYTFSNYVFVKSVDDERRPVTPETISLKRKQKKLFINGLLSIESGTFSGWVYEFIGEYEHREKNGFESRLVFLVLYGSKMFVLTPSQDLNEKRLKQLMTDNKTPTFVNQRIIDFSKQSRKYITLYLTKNVRNQRKYIWSKKYPICIEYNDDRPVNGGGYQFNGKGERLNPKNDPNGCAIEKLVIFARSCREKEEWFWAIKSSFDSSNLSKGSESLKNSTLSLAEGINNESSTIDLEQMNELLDFNHTTQQYLRILTQRVSYNTFMQNNILSIDGIGSNNLGATNPLSWFNVLINRLSFDLLNKPNWSAYIAKKLQRKLKKLRLPYFMESLTITEIDIGTTLPKFNSVPTVPVVDDGGIWIDFDVSYSGGFAMTLETKLNLMKLRTKELPNSESIPYSLSSLSASESGFPTPVSSPESPLSSPFPVPKQQKHWRGYKCVSRNNSSKVKEEIVNETDSDIDSIVTSSEDEEPETAPADPDDADTDEKQRKFTRFVDRIASSQYFQKATQINFFRKAIEGVSNMSIMLTVQINSLSGILAINIPESPSDRLWYGFRNDPVIQITTRPKVGDHDLNLHYVTNFIEKKLRAEFFNYFVIPHMDDFFIPALNTNIEQFISVVS